MSARDEWLAARREGVGASEVAAILGLSPWASPLSVWASKVLGEDEEHTADAEERMRWGSLLEPVILAEYARRTGADVHPVEQQTPDSIIRHARWDEGVRLSATLDAYLGSDGVVEVKTTSAYQAEAWTDGAPLHYQVQVQAQLACEGGARGVIVALVGGQRLVWHEVERDEAAIAMIEDAVAEFWGYVERREPPPASPTSVDVRVLERLHPDDSGETVQLGLDLAAMTEERESIAAEAKRLAERKTEIDAAIKTRLGPATFGALPDGRRWQWRWQERKETLVKASRSRVLRLVKGEK